MLPKLFVLFWLFLLPVLCADPALDSIFVIKKTDVAGGCASRYQTLQSYLAEARALVKAGLQAIKDAKDPSAKEFGVAKRYLYTYFRADDDDSIAAVERFMDNVKEFLDGNSKDPTPYLFCDDKWLEKRKRTDVAWDKDKNEIMEQGPDGAFAPVAIENVRTYHLWFWTQNNQGLWVKTAMVPYWSDDLKDYVFDVDYNGKTYCTSSKGNVGTTQDQTAPSTLTLCPSAFTNAQATVGLGSKTPKVRLSIEEVLPQSGTFYHELFHLAIGMEDSPDVNSPGCYKWKTTQSWLKNQPGTTPKGYDEDYQHLIRRSPESYVWFSVGYWYFQQTQWSNTANQRWSFDTGVAQLVSI